jgi:hypothetical protein
MDNISISNQGASTSKNVENRGTRNVENRGTRNVENRGIGRVILQGVIHNVINDPVVTQDTK